MVLTRISQRPTFILKDRFDEIPVLDKLVDLSRPIYSYCFRLDNKVHCFTIDF